MSVWVTIPSARPVEQVANWAQAWRAQGYRIALWRDQIDIRPAPRGFADVVCAHTVYPGYAVAVNTLIRDAIATDTSADWFVAAGDDVFPDTTRRADDIAAECNEYFFLQHTTHGGAWTQTFGVMQPTGDRWGDTEQSRSQFGERRGAYIDRVCGSAWIGRAFSERAYGGHGPLWREYHHMFVDEELQEVATRLGVFWQRRDLTQRHQHWGRGQGLNENELQNRDTAIPPHLVKVNGPEHWRDAKALFERRKSAGFPGHEAK